MNHERWVVFGFECALVLALAMLAAAFVTPTAVYVNRLAAGLDVAQFEAAR